MDSQVEQLVVEVESMIDKDELPNPLNEVFSLSSLQELVSRVYEEVLEATEIPADASDEQQANLIRELVEQVAMKVGAIAALSATDSEAINMQVNSGSLAQLVSALFKNQGVNIKLTTE